MPEPVKNKWSDEAGIKFAPSYSRLIETSATPSGNAFSTGIEVDKGFADAEYGAEIYLQWVWLKAKQFADVETVDNSSFSSGLKFHKTAKDILSYNEGHRFVSFTDTSYFSFGLGRVKVGGGEKRVGGEVFKFEDDKWGFFEYGSGHAWGAEFFIPGTRFTVSPWFGFGIQNVMPFAGKDARGDYANSPMNIKAELGLSFALSDISTTATEDSVLNGYDISYYILSDALELSTRPFRYANYDIPVGKGQQRLEEVGFKTSDLDQQTEDLRPLLLAQSYLKAVDVGEFMRSCYRAKSDHEYFAYARIATRVASGLATAGFGAAQGNFAGQQLMADGITDLGKALRGALAMSGISTEAQVGIEFLTFGAGTFISSALGSSGAGIGYSQDLLSVANTPARNPKSVSKTHVLWKPYTKYVAGKGDATGSLLLEKDLTKIKKIDSELFVRAELESHALSAPNVFARVENQAGENSSYNNLSSPTSGKAGAGLKAPLAGRTVNPFIAPHLYQQFGENTTPGVGATAGISFIEKHTGAEFRVETTGEIGLNGDPRGSIGGAIGWSF